jgi:hypothetical protein
MQERRTRLFWKRIAALALALALLGAWQAALEHPITHVDEHGEFVHVRDDGHSHEGESESGPLCDALAALTACAAAGSVFVAQVQSDYESPSYPSSAPRIAEAPPFLSQGPPASA